MTKKILRLIFSQWQGGNLNLYSFGAEVLNFLVPNFNQQIIEWVKIAPFKNKKPILENGVYFQKTIIKQLKEAQTIIEKHQPEKIITLGGDCHVSQAPIDYLNGKYQNEFGVLWIDAHPDISTPKNHQGEHAMVLGNLLGQGDPVLAKLVKHQLQPKQVLYYGFNQTDAQNYENQTVEKIKIDNVSPEETKNQGNQKVLEWIKQNGFKKLYLHWDLDVLDPKVFHSLTFSSPLTDVGAAQGKLNFEILEKLITELESATEIVGLTIAEYIPWDNHYLKEIFNKLSIFQK